VGRILRDTLGYTPIQRTKTYTLYLNDLE
jgi:hypothetical protein